MDNFSHIARFRSASNRARIARLVPDAACACLVAGSATQSPAPGRGPFCNAHIDEGRVKSILDRSFKYTPSTKTDLRKTFDRLRREQRLTNKATGEQPSVRAKNIFSLETR